MVQMVKIVWTFSRGGTKDEKTTTVFYFNIIALKHISCKNPVSSNSPVTVTEEWQLSVPQTKSNADISLQKHENGDISVSGNWMYNFYGNEITCTIMSGTLTKNTTKLIFNCSGTASYPPDSTGYKESSPFTLTMEGIFQNGQASGIWEISFSDEEWNAWAPEGVFTGQRETGSGITDSRCLLPRPCGNRQNHWQFNERKKSRENYRPTASICFAIALDFATFAFAKPPANVIYSRHVGRK